MKRKKPLKKKRMTALAILKRRLDYLWGAKIRERDGGRCQYSFDPNHTCKGALQAAHIYPKGRYPSVRHDLDNGVLLCQGAHMLIDNNPAQKEALALDKLGCIPWGSLRTRALAQQFKWRIEDLEKKIAEWDGEEASGE